MQQMRDSPDSKSRVGSVFEQPPSRTIDIGFRTGNVSRSGLSGLKMRRNTVLSPEPKPVKLAESSLQRPMEMHGLPAIRSRAQSVIREASDFTDK